MSLSLHGSTASTAITSTRPEFLINGLDEQINVQNILDDSNKFTAEGKVYKRDSGFHTMTRQQSNEKSSENLAVPSNNGAMMSLNHNITGNDGDNVTIERGQSARHRERSSPIITKKSFKLNLSKSETEINELALKLFKLEGKDKQNVVKHFSNKSVILMVFIAYCSCLNLGVLDYACNCCSKMWQFFPSVFRIKSLFYVLSKIAVSTNLLFSL